MTSDPHLPLDEIDLKCPITHMLFYDPVLASDEVFYEHQAILNWFRGNSTSPTTGSVIKNKTLKPSILIKNLVSKYLEAHPEKKVDQYKPDSYPKLLGHYGLVQVSNQRNHFYEYYVQLWTPTRKNDHFKLLMDDDEFVNATIIRYTKVSEVFHQPHPLFFLCAYGSVPQLKFFMEFHKIDTHLFKLKNADFMEFTGETPIHVAFKFNNYDLLEYITKLENVDLTVLNSQMNSPLHYACQYGDEHEVKLLLNKNVDINAKNIDFESPLCVACIFGNLPIIRLLLNRGATFTPDKNNRNHPLTLIRKNSTEQYLKWLPEFL